MAENSRFTSDEDLRKEIAKLEEHFQPDNWTGTVEDVFQAYGGLAEVFVRNFPGELQLAMADYDRGQFDAKTREIVYGLTKHMKTLGPDQQWGSQQAIKHAKTAAARHLIEDPGYRQQRAEFQDALTLTNERHLDMIYGAERRTLQALGLGPDHSPDGARQSERMQTNLDLAETYSEYRHNLEAFANAQAALLAEIGGEAGREVQAPEAAKTDIERIGEQLEEYKRSLRENGFDRRSYDFQLTRGAYLDEDVAEWERRIDADHAHDREQLDQLGAREERGFLRLIAKLDEAIRDEEREQFETTGQPEPAERLAREAVRAGFYIEAIQQFIVHQSTLQHVREEALSLAYDANSSRLDDAHEALRNPEEVERALQDAKTQIEDLKRRQAGRSVAVELLQLAGNER